MDEKITAQCLIEDYTSKGHGFGFVSRPSGVRAAAEVFNTMPGDLAEVELLKKRKGRFATQLLRIVEGAKERVQPRCQHAEECGGCKWQHVSYTEQLRLKMAEVQLCFPQHKAHPIIPCENPWHYRNKVEYSFSNTFQDGEIAKRFMGFNLKTGRGRLVDLQECHLVPGFFLDALNLVRAWVLRWNLRAYHGYSDSGQLRELTVREGKNTGDRLVMLTVSGNPSWALTKECKDDFIACLQPLKQEGHRLSIFLTIQQIAKGRPTQFFEMHLDGPDHLEEQLTVLGHAYKFRVSPSAFFQPNTKQAEILYSQALALAELRPDDVVYDLFCGTGTLGICAARQVREVYSVEINRQAVWDVEANKELNGVSNLTAIAGDVGLVLEKLDKACDVAIIDPPRAGLDAKALSYVLKAAPRTILYISCNPTTQAANIAELVGYELVHIQPVDQFPHTVHIENICVLRKKSAV